jgi:putative PIG3 family NAD(P)H quinone oxidoreductase
MRAVEISTPGAPDVLRIADRPTPRPGPRDVLIRVAAAGVNRPDVMQRLGKYPPPPGASDIPGLEVAGTIVETGASVTEWQPGDRVCALVAGGGYADHCVAPAPQCLPIPAFPPGFAPPVGLAVDDATAAAAIPETFFTVWTNVFERGRLARGERLLVHGGSSGIGTTAIQLARARGATVFATAGSADKCRACERLGAARAIDYRREDFVAAVLDATGGQGVDVVLNIIGGDYVPRSLQVLAREGRLVQIATMESGKAEIPLTLVMQKRLWITGSTLRPRSVDEKGAIASALRAEVWPMLQSGRVGPIVHATFPLERAADAHRLMESSAHVGKIVLTCE